MSMFYVGQRVVCVADPHYSTEDGVTPNIPLVGEVYTVRQVGQFEFENGVDVAIWLEEIVNPVCEFEDGDCCEHGFWHARFRPVKDTSIEVFRKLLAPMPEREDA